MSLEIGTPSITCAGCGTVLPADEPLPFACPRRPALSTEQLPAGGSAADDTDHVLSYELALDGLELPTDGHPNPFIRYRELLWIWHAARARGLSDPDYIDLVTELDACVAEVDGHGFTITPYGHSPELDTHYKNETANVAGSHKARHLMGIAIQLAIIERCGAAPWSSPPELAIASCGNAALAAAVVARAAGRTLKVFLPSWAEPKVIAKLRALEAELIVCQRGDDDPAGDPCYRGFREAVARGALPFSCQGPDNGLAIDGGRTLGLELVAQHRAGPWPALTHLVIQVGGGALASSTWQALETAHRIGALHTLPALLAVQTEGGHPLARAWTRLVAAGPDLETAVANAASERSQYMWPWQPPPRSMATGILDDETYDWWQLVRGMAATAGSAVLASELDIETAQRAAQRSGIATSATGAAGYAGLLAAHRQGLSTAATTAVLFTGAQR